MATNEAFKIKFDERGISSLEPAQESPAGNFITAGKILGNLMIHYRIEDGKWIRASTEDKTTKEQFNSSLKKYTSSYSFIQEDDLDLILESSFRLGNEDLTWRLSLQNRSGKTIEIGDIGLPMEFNTDFVGESAESTYLQRLIRHRFVSGHGSFMYWGPANGKGPYLVMTPNNETKLEYFDRNYEAYIHSKVIGGEEKRGTWRQSHTSVTLSPQNRSGSSVSYSFKFQWADNLGEVRNLLYQNHGFDVQVVPGMVLPGHRMAKFSIRTKNRIDSIVAEFPSQTHLESVGAKTRDTHLYQVSFSKPGENRLTVHFNDGQYMVLEFFSSESLETLIKKRGNFIANRQQHRASDKWYDGLFSLWDMKNSVLRSPENTGSLQEYMVGGSDDPSNSKPAYLSAKNVVYPDSREISSLEYYLEKFVWGGLQRKDHVETAPYGIYGSPNWYQNRNFTWGTRDSSLIKTWERRYGTPENTGLGKERMWRSFDYTTFIMTYYNMYRIAKMYPEMTRYLDASGYLERAFGTAKAFFEIPYSIYMPGPPLWSHEGYWDKAYKQGNFHEKYIVDLVKTLRKEGWDQKADWLEKEWSKKVKYFIYDATYPFGSEMDFDRTAFESTHAIAKYALENSLKPGDSLWYDKNLDKWYSHPEVNRDSVIKFMNDQIRANVVLRGWLEPSYYYMGSARTGATYNLDYMSQMGGWSILDYAINYTDKTSRYLRLGYASLLSSWALMNTGSSSKFGYWYPGEENDGAVGWGFKAEKYGNTWIGKPIGRGAWYYDGSIDHGLSSYLKSARTIVVRDSLFGWIAYGGELERTKRGFSIIPRDGVRQHLTLIRKDRPKLRIRLNRDGFAENQPVFVEEELQTIQLALESRTKGRHQTDIELSGMTRGIYVYKIDGVTKNKIKVRDRVSIPVSFNKKESKRLTIKKYNP